MMKRAHNALLGTMLVCAGVAFSPAAWTQSRQSSGGATSSARQRWDGFSAEEKRRLKSRFGEFRQLDSARRQELQRRARLLRSQRESARSRLPSDLRSKLEQLEPRQRREVVDEFMRTEMRRRGGRIRDRLPADWIERLEAADPSERRRVMRLLRAQMRGANDAATMKRMAEKLGLGPQQVRELQALSRPDRQAALLELRREDIEAKVELRGLPSGISREQWDGRGELSTVEFFELWHQRTPFPQRRSEASSLAPRTTQALRRALQPQPSWRQEWRTLSAVERREKLEVRLIERALQALESADEVEPEELDRLRTLDYRQFRWEMRKLIGGNLPGPPARGGQSGALAPETAAALRKVLRLDPRWVIEFAELPAAERSRRIQGRLRERVFELLEASTEVDPPDLERLRRLFGRELIEALRRFAQPLPRHKPSRG